MGTLYMSLYGYTVHVTVGYCTCHCMGTLYTSLLVTVHVTVCTYIVYLSNPCSLEDQEFFCSEKAESGEWQPPTSPSPPAHLCRMKCAA